MPFAIAVSLTLLSAAPQTGATPDENLARRLDAYVAPFAGAEQLSGTLLVARGDDVLFERSYGMANYEHRVPNRPDTRQCIASITKDMTLVIAARLIERGELALSDPLEGFVPGFANGERITVEHLIRHRAGIPHRVTEPMEETVPRTAAEMADLAREAEPLCEPGAESIYSSAGYSVLARVLEIAGGKDYARLLQDEVCAPANMEHTVHTNSRALLADRAQSYVLDAGGLRNAALKDLSFLVGAGSVWSTPRDLLRFLHAILAGDHGPTARQAILQGGEDVHMNGATNGFRAFLDHDGATDVTVIFAGNLSSGANDLVRHAAPRIVAGEEVEAVAPPSLDGVQVAPAVLARYEGEYELRPGRTLPVRAVDGGLRIGEWILIPRGERTFFSPQDYAEVRVVLDDEGLVSHLDWAGQRMPRVGGP